MSRPKRDLFRLSCNLPAQLIEAVDKYAEGLNISRTTAIIVLLSNALADYLGKD